MKKPLILLFFTLFICLGMNAQTATGTVSPSSITLETITGTAVTATVTITNTGTVAFTPLAGFNSSYGYFTVSNMPNVPATPGDNVRTLTITYLPLTAGTHTGGLTLKIGDVSHHVSLTGYATEAPQVVRGDVDYNDIINIKDVTEMINLLLSDCPYNSNADCNLDGEITISDVTALINYLLRDTWVHFEGSTIDPDDPNLEIFNVNGIEFKMVHVEGGTFLMGKTEEQGSSGYSSEKPVHEVTLSTFSIGQTEVTQKLWFAVMGENPSACRGVWNRPVENVNWNDCKSFITRLNQITGKTFRLPTEAEWEYAARGGSLSQGFKYSGSMNANEVGWFYNNCHNVTQPVATKLPNELGIYDMSGNVSEWCSDWYGSYSSQAQTNPTGPSTGEYRVRRGGAWTGDNDYGRVSSRSSNSASYRYYGIGMRLVL